MKSVILCAGALNNGLKQALSMAFVNRSMAIESLSFRSLTLSCTTIPLLAQRPEREAGLIPFTTRASYSVLAWTIIPPGHMQNEYTPLPSTWAVKL